MSTITLEQFLEVRAYNPNWLADAARTGKLPPDPLYDLSVEIVTELEREITSRGTSWSDVSLHDVVSEIIRETLKEKITNDRTH